MNSQRFRAAAFITQTWLKWWTPQASRGLMILLCLLSFTSAEGMPLNSSLGCLHAPNEGSLTTSYSRFLCSYSAQSHGKWKRLTPPPPPCCGSPLPQMALPTLLKMMMSTCVCVCVTSWHVLQGIHWCLLNCPLLKLYSAQSVYSWDL